MISKIPHHWVVMVVCDQCGLPQDRAGHWCDPKIALPREPGA